MTPSIESDFASFTQAETLAAAAALHLEDARKRCDRTPQAPGVKKALRAAAEAFVAASGEAAAAALQRGNPLAAEKWLTDALVHLDGVGSGAPANLEQDCAEALLRLRAITRTKSNQDEVTRIKSMGQFRPQQSNTSSVPHLRHCRSSGALRPRSACLTGPPSLGYNASCGNLHPSRSSSQRPSSAGPCMASGLRKSKTRQTLPPPKAKCPPKIPPLPFFHRELDPDCEQELNVDCTTTSVEHTVSSSKLGPGGSSRLSSRSCTGRFPKIPPLLLNQVEFGTNCKQNDMEQSTASSQASSESVYLASTWSQNCASLQKQSSCPDLKTITKNTTMSTMLFCERPIESTKECLLPQRPKTSNCTATAPPLPPLPASLPSLPSSPEHKQNISVELRPLSNSHIHATPFLEYNKMASLDSAEGAGHRGTCAGYVSGEGQALASGHSEQLHKKQAEHIENIPSLRLPCLGGAVQNRSATQCCSPLLPPLKTNVKPVAPKDVVFSGRSSGRLNWSNMSIFSDQLTSETVSEQLALEDDDATGHHAAAQLQRWWRRKAQKRKANRPATLRMLEACALVVQRRFRARREQMQYERGCAAARTLQRWVRLILIPKQRDYTKRSRREHSALHIQQVWRERRVRNLSATVIQCAWRSFWKHRLALIEKVVKLASEPSACAAVKVSHRLQATLTQAAAAELQRRTEAARVIAWALGGHVVRRKFVRSRAAAIVLQRCARLALARRRAATTLQRYWRGASVRKVQRVEGVLIGSCVKRCSYGPVVHCEIRAWLSGNWTLSAAAVCSRSGGLQKQFLDLKHHRQAAGNVQPAELARRWLQDLSVTWREARPVLYLPQRPPGSVLQHLPSRSLSRSSPACNKVPTPQALHGVLDSALRNGDQRVSQRVTDRDRFGAASLSVCSREDSEAVPLSVCSTEDPTPGVSPVEFSIFPRSRSMNGQTSGSHLPPPRLRPGSSLPSPPSPEPRSRSMSACSIDSNCPIPRPPLRSTWNCNTDGRGGLNLHKKFARGTVSESLGLDDANVAWLQSVAGAASASLSDGKPDTSSFAVFEELCRGEASAKMSDGKSDTSSFALFEELCRGEASPNLSDGKSDTSSFAVFEELCQGEACAKLSEGKSDTSSFAVFEELCRGEPSAKLSEEKSDTSNFAVFEELHPGDKVKIHGLKKQVHLNGQIAILESFIDSSQRWRVQLEDGEKKDLKDENIARRLKW